MAKKSISPTGRTSNQPRKSREGTSLKKNASTEEKQKGAVKSTIKSEFAAKRESLLRLKKLEQVLARQNMGLTHKKGTDMAFDIKEIIRTLKESKRKRDK